MGGESSCLTVQNEVISEKRMAIKRLKRGESQGQKFGSGKMCFWGSLARWHFSNPLARSAFPEDWGLQAE
jgi:hypothetical protein